MDKFGVTPISVKVVTILILIDGFLQFKTRKVALFFKDGHNPYFNRWFSAILKLLFLDNASIKSQSLF